MIMHVDAPTLQEYAESIQVKNCRWCGESLENLPVERYPHAGGWYVNGYKERQWLYITCPKCGYQWALWKLGVPR